MGTSYSIDRARRLVRSRAWGVVTEEDLRDHYSHMMADPLFESDFQQIIDLRRLEAALIRPRELQTAAAMLRFDVGTRRAFVATTAAGEELAARYSGYARAAGQDVRVFGSVDDAEAWLALQPPRGADGVPVTSPTR